MATRKDVSFRSGDDTCAAWLYRAQDADGLTPCVVMAHGFSMTRHDGLETYAKALAGAGATVLIFDHRYLGDSGGEPRQHFRIKKQEQDYEAAVAYARSLDGVDPERIIVWGFSFSGGTAVNVAAKDARIAGVMLLCPFLDGAPRVLGTVRRTPLVAAGVMAQAIKDLAGSHTLIPVTGPPGALAAMAFEGEAEGFAASAPTTSPWRNEISPGIFATVALHRPVRKASRLGMPVWVGLGERDITVSGKAIERLAAKAPRAELHRYDVDHFEPFYGADPAAIAADQAEWLTRTGLAT
ncbi:MAG: alpha/beta hydrolase [Aeromicrobium sp.]|nr:alpha/beta hydrolase [Aeromicrobium sp.]